MTGFGCAEHVAGYKGGCPDEGVVVEVDVDEVVDDDDDEVLVLELELVIVVFAQAPRPLSGHCSEGLASGCWPTMLPAAR